jgi:hypothetical protein
MDRSGRCVRNSTRESPGERGAAPRTCSEWPSTFSGCGAPHSMTAWRARWLKSGSARRISWRRFCARTIPVGVARTSRYAPPVDDGLIDPLVLRAKRSAVPKGPDALAHGGREEVRCARAAGEPERPSAEKRGRPRSYSDASARERPSSFASAVMFPRQQLPCGFLTSHAQRPAFTRAVI